MGRSKIIRVTSALMLLAGLSSACRKQDYTVEYGVDGYIWLARKMQDMDGTEDNFSKDKSPEEAAKVIQNRVQLLLNER